MRTAFVGKGGSGKSTLAALFIDYLNQQNQNYLAVDADINQHLAELIGAEFKDDLALSKTENAARIREYVAGDNPRIEDPSNVVKSTPPGRGSNLIRLGTQNELLESLTVEHDGNLFMHVGTYEKEGIGASCYHTALNPFENILSHLKLGEDEWLVADMVAGTDAFANTLHAQFDLIVLVVEPTPEGIDVYQKYKELSKEADVFDQVKVVGNMVDREHDIEYLEENVDEEIIGYLPRKSEIKMARQRQESLNLDLLSNEEISLFDRIRTEAKNLALDSDQRLEKLKDIHRKVAQQQYIIDACGDVEKQIDPEFSWEDV